MNKISEPMISIIIPSLNQGKYIKSCLDSIVKQDYKNVELILLDGGSTDESIDIIKDYEKYITFWRSRNDEGQCSALIEGFNMAKGDLMGWLNCDDILLPNSLKRIAITYKNNPKADIFYGNFILIDKAGMLTHCQRVPKKYISWFAERGHWIFNGTGCFFKPAVYRKVGGLNVGLNYVMDADLYIRMLNIGSKPKHTGHYLAAFRRHEDAKTVKNATDCRKEHHTVATKYWPNKAAKGRQLRRYLYLYWIYQLLNGNVLMYFDKRYTFRYLLKE